MELVISNMELKTLTTGYSTDKRTTCKQIFKEGNDKLNKAEGLDDNLKCKVIRDKYK